MTRCSLFITYLFIATGIVSQNYIDYVGAGHMHGVTITTSHDTAGRDGTQTGNGEGMMPDLAGASRFLAQATLGADYETIESVAHPPVICKQIPTQHGVTRTGYYMI